MSQNGNVVTITHKEYIGEVGSTNANWAINTYPINPGVASSFPWLSQIAGRFESYIIDRMVYIYEPVCSTATIGSVMMAIDYDAGDAAPTTKVTMLSYRGAARTSPWGKTMFNAHGSDLHKFGIQRYVRTSGQPGDIKTFDVGNFYIATQGTPASATALGELHVAYTIRFFTPQIQVNAAFTNRTNPVVQVGAVAVTPVSVSLKSAVYGPVFKPYYWLDNSGVPSGFWQLILDLNQEDALRIMIKSTNYDWTPNSGLDLQPFAMAQNKVVGMLGLNEDAPYMAFLEDENFVTRNIARPTYIQCIRIQRNALYDSTTSSNVATTDLIPIMFRGVPANPGATINILVEPTTNSSYEPPSGSLPFRTTLTPNASTYIRPTLTLQTKRMQDENGNNFELIDGSTLPTRPTYPPAVYTRDSSKTR